MSDNNQVDNNSFINGGSVFWMMMVVISLAFLIQFSLWSWHAASIKGAIIAFIYFMMIVTGIILSRFQIFNFGTWSSNSFSFTVGFLIWGTMGVINGIKAGTFSMLSVSQSNLYASIASELPQHIEYILDTLLIPIAEDIFWVIGLPFVLFMIMDQIGNNIKNADIFENKVFQLIVVIIITGISFATFHIGKLNWSFLISAFIFRSITIGLVFADLLFDVLPKFKLVAGFSLGAHIGNNLGFTLAREGVGNFFSVLNNNMFPSNILIYVFFGVLILSGINQIGILIRRGEIHGS